MNTINIYISLALILCFGLSASAENKGMMFLKGTPQSSTLNPALKLQEGDKWYLAFPALGSFSASVSTAAFSWNQATYIKDNTLFFDIPSLSKAVKGDNPIDANMSMQILGFGFKIKEKHYVSFDLNTKVKSTTNVPGSIFNLQYGNWDADKNTPINHHIQDLTANAISYVEASLGYSYELSEKLTVGARVKYIQGAVATQTNSMDLYINTNSDGTMSTQQNISQQIVAPISVTENADGTINQISLDSDANEILDSTIGKNTGFGFDFGATYKVTDKLTVGFSMIDLGKINWKGKTQEIYTEGSFEYAPIDVSDDITGNSDGEKNTQLDEYLDDLKNSFKLRPGSTEAFSTSLFQSTNISAQYELKDWVSLGGLLQFNHLNNTNATLSTTLSPGKALSALFSYSMRKHDAPSFGAGLMLRGACFQLYALTDSFTSFTNPGNAKYINLQLGINLVF
ncbi:MAG: DUF5723 family protein [Mangrovibacterium sp.]